MTLAQLHSISEAIAGDAEQELARRQSFLLSGIRAAYRETGRAETDNPHEMLQGIASELRQRQCALAEARKAVQR